MQDFTLILALLSRLATYNTAHIQQAAFVKNGSLVPTDLDLLMSSIAFSLYSLRKLAKGAASISKTIPFHFECSSVNRGIADDADHLF